MRRFSALGSADFEASFASQMQEMAADFAAVLGDQLEALVLVGGYGRGEGGVLKTAAGEFPYNDLDLVPIVNREWRRWPAALDAARRDWQQRLRIHVDFARPMTPHDVANWPRLLLWHDVVHGHRVLWGDSRLVQQTAPEDLFEPLPVLEATRLLVNRGAGLIEAARRFLMAEAPDLSDPDFVRRNLYKADLAMMDALLIAHGEYRASVFERPSRLQGLINRGLLVGAEGLLASSRNAVRFKLLPSAVSQAVGPEDFKLRFDRMARILAHVETIRRRRPTSIAALVASKAAWEPDEERLARLPIHVFRQLRSGRVDWRSPRQPLLSSLALLLTTVPFRGVSSLGVGGADTIDVAPWCSEAGDFFSTWQRNS